MCGGLFLGATTFGITTFCITTLRRMEFNAFLMFCHHSTFTVYTECCSDECPYAACCFAKCRSDKCHSAGCCGVSFSLILVRELTEIVTIILRSNLSWVSQPHSNDKLLKS